MTTPVIAARVSLERKNSKRLEKFKVDIVSSRLFGGLLDDFAPLHRVDFTKVGSH